MKCRKIVSLALSLFALCPVAVNSLAWTEEEVRQGEMYIQYAALGRYVETQEDSEKCRAMCFTILEELEKLRIILNDFIAGRIDEEEANVQFRELENLLNGPPGFNIVIPTIVPVDNDFYIPYIDENIRENVGFAILELEVFYANFLIN